MPVLDRCLLKELAYSMAFTLAVITSVFFSGAAVKLLHKYPNLDLMLLGKALPFFMLHHLEFVLPLSLLISVVMVYGRAASNNEFTTIKASGIHPYRILLPAFLLAGVVSLASVYSANEISPIAENLFKAQLKNKDNIRAILESNITDEHRQFEQGDLSVSWKSEQIPEDGGLVLHDVLIIQDEKAGQREAGEEQGEVRAELTIFHAVRVLVAFDLHSDSITLRPEELRVLEGKGVGARVDQVSFALSLGTVVWNRRLKYRTGSELISLYDRAVEGDHPFRSRAELLSEIHGRVALSTCSLFFVLIGAPLALVFRSSSRVVAFLLAFLVVLFVFYPTHLVSGVLIDQQLVHPVLAAWSGNLILGALGAGMLLFVVRK